MTPAISGPGFQRGWAQIAGRDVAHVWRRARGGVARLCGSRRVVPFRPSGKSPLHHAQAPQCRRCAQIERARAAGRQANMEGAA